MGWRRHQHDRDDGVEVAVPCDEAANEAGGERVAGAAPTPRAPAVRQLLGPQLDAPDLAGMRRQLVRRRPSVRRDDRQHLPVDLGEAADQQVAPRADAADGVRVGALGDEQHARRTRLERRRARAATTRTPGHVALASALAAVGARVRLAAGRSIAVVASASSFASKATIARSISRQISSSDSRMTRPSNSSWAVSSLAPSLSAARGRQRARPLQQPADVGPPVLGRLQAGVLLAQEHELRVDRGQRLAGSAQPVVLQRCRRLAGSAAAARRVPRRSSLHHPEGHVLVRGLADFASLAMATSR